MNDYERIARIIAYLDEHHIEQPDLAVLASRVGLSPFHFHRLFSKWAGITPKDFLQCLTLTHARKLLREGTSVLDAALMSGLSGPGRLHDLCITLEAVSPGELKSAGTGCEIHYGFAGTPFGDWLVAQSKRGLCHLSFFEPGGSAKAVEELRSEWTNASFIRDDVMARAISALIFRNSEQTTTPRTLRALVRGTPFQISVWRALIRVPPGALVSYGQLAAAIDMPHGARAVGSAAANNRLAFLIPCHRVIRETGLISDYRWGPTRKRSMIAWESARAFQKSDREPRVNCQAV